MTGFKVTAQGHRAKLLATVALGVLIISGPAWAGQGSTAPQQVAQATPAYTFDIAAQGLADALALLGQQAGVQVSAHGDLVRTAKTAGVRGTMSLDSALQRLLTGTGLRHRLSADGVVTLEPIPQGNGASVLSPVVVSGTTLADAYAGAADRASSFTITSTDLERRNPTTIKEVFAGEAGVSVGGAIPLSQKVYVHGVEEHNLAVSIDGARQNNKIFHHNATNLIDPALLKAARVDPGVAGADAGPGALGGAISYETVDAADLLAPGQTLGGFVTASIDSNTGTFTNGNSAYGRIDGFELLGFLKWGKGGEYDGGDGREVAGTGTDMTSGLGKLAYQAQKGHRFEFTAEQVKDKADRPYRANIGRLTNRNEPAVREYDLTRRNFTLSYAQPENNGLWDPTVVLARSYTDLAVPVPSDSEGVTGSYSGKFANDFNLSKTDIISAGLDFYRDSAQYKDPTTDVEEKADNIGLFAQARLEPMETLRLSFGGRADQQWFEGIDGTTIDQAGISGNASAALDVTDQITLKAGYSHVWGGVALAENFIMNPAWNYSAGIEPVRSDNYTVGAEFHHRGFTFDAGIFRSNFDNARDPVFRGAPGLTADFRTEGFDIGVGYDWGPGFARLSYTDSKITLNGAATDSDATQYFGTPLGRVIALEVAHDFDALDIRVGGTVDAALKNTDTVDAGGMALPSYEVFGLYVDYNPPQVDFLTLRLEANNIFDEAYADRATYGQEFSNVRPLLEPGRSFLLSAKARF